MTDVLIPAVLDTRRAAVRCLSDGRKVSTDDEATRYVDERGFCPLMHLSGCELPSISEADIRDPWAGFDITDGAWRWKETLPQARRCAYGKFFKQRGFFISWGMFPAFYALSGNPPGGSEPSGGFRQDYEDGLLGRLEWLVLETVQERGPIDSRQLWRALKNGFGANRSRFEQALVTLQSSFRIMVAGGHLEGWSMHRWDLVTRQAPVGLLNHLPAPDEARTSLLKQYVANTLVCTVREAAGFFRWELTPTQLLAAHLVAAGDLTEANVEGWKGTWLSTHAET